MINKRSFNWKCELVERAFTGTDSDGKHSDMYVDYLGKRRFSVEIRGIFKNTVNTLPLTGKEMSDLLRIDPQYVSKKEIPNLLIGHKRYCH